MRKYADYAGASISMSADRQFTDALEDLFSRHDIDAVFESGTFQGLGSTTSLARAIVNNKVAIKHFYTLEVDYKFYRMARKNLKQFPFITCKWGLSVDSSEAKRFIENDEAIREHLKYPDIFIDDVVDPKGFYLNELSGRLSRYQAKKQRLTKTIRSWVRSLFRPEKFSEDLLSTYLPSISAGVPLILLDSAGGIGFLEFNKVRELLADRQYYLILDDINHLKHFRSYRHIQGDPHFSILHESVEQGWLIARHCAIIS